MAHAKTQKQDQKMMLGLRVKGFADQFAQFYPHYIRYIISQKSRSSIFGTQIPYHVSQLSSGDSLGHCVRTDSVLDKQGLSHVSEADYVPSSRGMLLASLNEEQRGRCLDVFSRWYSDMGVEKVFYATGSKTICAQESAYFASVLRERSGLEISSVNIDEQSPQEKDDVFIDRLFYRSEAQTASLWENHDLFSTKEPFLDSKMTLAPIHYDCVQGDIESFVGSEGLNFLRSVIPRTEPFTFFSRQQQEELFREDQRNGSVYNKKVFKGSEVEHDTSWGCRSTLIGADNSRQSIMYALQGHGPKALGLNPIVQDFKRSKNFRRIWNDAVRGRYVMTPLQIFGNEQNEPQIIDDVRHVFGRVGIFFLIDRKRCACSYVPYGLLTLRNSHLVHGASDSMYIPFEIVDR